MGWNLGHTVRWLREQKKLTQAELADKAGVSVTTIYRLEKNSNYEGITLAAVAGALGTNEARLLDFAAPFEPPPHPGPGVILAPHHYAEAERDDGDTYAGYKPHDIPVIAEGEASPQGALFWNSEEGKPLVEADEWMSRPPEVKDPRAYAVRVRGDSMVPAFYPGMRLIVSPNIPVKSGHRVYVELHSGERLVKVARRQKNGWILDSVNPAYEPRFVADEEVGTMHKIVYGREL